MTAAQHEQRVAASLLTPMSTKLKISAGKASVTAVVEAAAAPTVVTLSLDQPADDDGGSMDRDALGWQKQGRLTSCFICFICTF